MTTDQSVHFAPRAVEVRRFAQEAYVYAQAVRRGCPHRPWPIRLGLAYGVRQLAALLRHHRELLLK